MILLQSLSSIAFDVTSWRRSLESPGLQSNGTLMNSAPTYEFRADHVYRDSEDSAPAEYPPEQPGVDQEEEDGTAYGAEEAEMQAALEKELEETEKANTNGDAEMGGVEDQKPEVKEDDEVSEAGSEDLEADSSDDDDDDEEEEGGDNDEDLEMADGEGKPAVTNGDTKSEPALKQEVMVH